MTDRAWAAALASLAVGCTFGGTGGVPQEAGDLGTAESGSETGVEDSSTGSSGQPPPSVDGSTGTDTGAALPEGARRRRLKLGEASALADAPVLVALDATRVEYDVTLDAGADLYFTTEGGAIVPHAIEAWDPNGRSAVWVRLPADLPTEIFMVYGTGQEAPKAANAAVWDEAFGGVWHFDDAPDGITVSDASGHDRHGRADGVWRTDDGWIGPGLQSAGVPIEVTNPPDLDGELTVEAWVHREPGPPSDSQFVALHSGGFALRVVEPGLAQPRLRIWRPEAGTVESGPMFSLAEQWTYVAATYAEGEIRFYVDGALERNEAFDPLPIASPRMALLLGRNLDGEMDELRISTVARSESWIEAQHRSMTDAVLTFGEPEALP